MIIAYPIRSLYTNVRPLGPTPKNISAQYELACE